MSTPSLSRNPFRVLAAHQNFRIFWTGQTLSLVGSWMQTMAVGWLALELSNSAFVVGLVTSVGALPVVLFSMHAGAIVDRSERLRIVRITQSILLAQAAILWLVTLTGHVNVPMLLALSLVQGVCSAIEIPARQSMIIQLVGRDDLQPAIALNSSGFNLARVIGPAVGGLVINTLGIAWCFGLNALSFVAVLWGLLLIRLPIVPRPRRDLGVRELVSRSTHEALDGLRFLWQRGPVRDLLSVVVVASLFGAPFLTLMPVVARDRLGTGAGGYGGLLASIGVGGLVGALAIAGPAGHWRRGRTMQVSAVLFPLLVILFALSTSLWGAYVILFGVGVAMIAFNALSNGTLQLLVPDQYRGRLMAFYSLVFIGLSQAVGSLVVGAAARLAGTTATIVVFEAAVLLFASLMFSRSPALRNL